MARSQRKSDAKGNGRQSSNRGKRPRGITRKSARLQAIQHLKEQPDIKGQTTEQHPLPSPSINNTRRSRSQNLPAYKEPSYLDQRLGQKRKRSQGTKDSVPQRKDQHVDRKRTTSTKENQEHHRLPSPSTSNSHKQLSGKRRRAVSPKPGLEETSNRSQKRRKVLRQTQQLDNNTSDPVAHWARTYQWPKGLLEQGLRMSETPSSKRRSESSHRSQTLERMATHGVFMQTSNLIRKDSETLCETFLEGERKIVESSIFTAEQFSRVLERVQNLNEARLQRDVTPWIVPSAETLFLRGRLKINYICEELNAEWVRCATMGSTKPKPDFTGGLLPTAFTDEEISKLENYAQPTKPFRFTPGLSFPFLVCEVKTGEEGLNKADRQNIHSASIAVRALITLYQEAFGYDSDRVKQLYGAVLVFSISHDNDRTLIYGHFAVADPSLPDGLKFYRYPIAIFSSVVRGGKELLRSYNFVMNVYEKFAPAHLKRIQDAVKNLPRPAKRTGLSFTASNNISLGDSESQQDSQELLHDDTFRKPRESASSSQTTIMKAQMEQQAKQMKQQAKQMEQQAKESKEQMDKLLKQLEQQRKESKEKEERMERQIKTLTDLLAKQIAGR